MTNRKDTPKKDKTSVRDCEIHGKCNHTTAHNSKTPQQYYKHNSNNKNANKDKNSERPRFNTQFNTKKKEENDNLSHNPNNDSSDVESEIHQIEEVFNINDSNHNSNGVSTEICVEGEKVK
jgi:hypothetical protein